MSLEWLDRASIRDGDSRLGGSRVPATSTGNDGSRQQSRQY